MASFLCPHCGSAQVQRVKALVESTHSVKSRELTAGLKVPLAPKEKATLVFGIGRSKHQADSPMLARLAPPEQYGYVGKVALLLVFVMMTLAMSDLGAKALYAGLSCLLAFFLHRAYQHNQRDWPRLMGTWEKSWYCHQCGELFLP